MQCFSSTSPLPPCNPILLLGALGGEWQSARSDSLKGTGLRDLFLLNKYVGGRVHPAMLTAGCNSPDHCL